MRYRSLLCLVALALTAEGLGAPLDFVLIGNSEVSGEEILERIGEFACAGQDSVCVESVCRAVAEYYWEAGFLGVEVECGPASTASETVEVRILEGPVSLVREVSLTGTSREEAASLEALFSGLSGHPFSPSQLEQGIASALEYYDRTGYPLSKIEPEMIWLGDNWIDLSLGVTKGPRARLNHVAFKGARRLQCSGNPANSCHCPQAGFMGQSIQLVTPITI